MVKTDPQAVERLLSHQTALVVDRAHLRARLLKGGRLRVKIGVDPTRPDLHIGHAVVLRKLRSFQDLGHTVVFIIGDATARIGDPSLRIKTRPPLSDTEIQAHANTYFSQVGRVLNTQKAEVRRNSEWLDQLTFRDLVRLLQQVTLARVLERDDFTNRWKAGAPIGLHEIIYPLIQAYDSVAVQADVEIGGTDQTFNLLAGRDLQPHYGQPAQDILTLPLLVGLDGKEKMSKSLQNVVDITESPDSMIGKLMTIPDAAIADYARLAADWSEEKLKEIPRRLRQENPRDLKREVARDITAQYHSASAAQQAAAEWLRILHKKELPRSIPTQKLRAGAWNVDALLVATHLVSSKSEAKRVHAQGGVRKNERRVAPSVKTLSVMKGDLLQVGKRNFVRIR